MGMQDQNNQSYFEGLARAYSEARPTYPLESLKKIHEYYARRGSDNEMVILDVGAGTGIFTDLLEREFSGSYSQVVGLEPGADMRRQAEEALEGSNIQFLKGAAEALPFSDQSAHLIATAQAIHWFDRPAFYREVLRVLVPHGVVVIISNDRDWRNSEFLARHEEILEKYGCTKEGAPYQRTYREYPLDEELEQYFIEVEEYSYHWTRNMSADQFLIMARSSTQVKRAIDRHGEEVVLSKIQNNLTKNFNNKDVIVVPYKTKLYLAAKGEVH